MGQGLKFWYLFLFAMVHGSPSAVAEQTAHRVMTYKIRLDKPVGSLNNWSQRRDLLTSQIHWLRPGIFGLQEVVINQKRDIANALPNFTAVGKGRHDIQVRGESSPIGFNRQCFRLLSRGAFWLSLTPDVPSKGWDAAFTRAATWIRLLDRGGGKAILDMNTHWDQIGTEARKHSALLLRQWRIRHRRFGDHVLLMSDFNCETASEPLQILTDLKRPIWIRDAGLTSVFRPFGPVGTFNGFKPQPTEQRTNDHILVGGQMGEDIWISRYAVFAQNVDGRMISDHNPVLADLVLN